MVFLQLLLAPCLPLWLPLQQRPRQQRWPSQHLQPLFPLLPLPLSLPVLLCCHPFSSSQLPPLPLPGQQSPLPQQLWLWHRSCLSLGGLLQQLHHWQLLALPVLVQQPRNLRPLQPLELTPPPPTWLPPWPQPPFHLRLPCLWWWPSAPLPPASALPF